MYFPSIKGKVGVFIIIIIALLAFFGYSRIRASKYESIKVTRGNLLITVAASGKVKSETEVALKFPIAGKLTSINVKENDQVKKGQVIATLDDVSLSNALQKAWNDLLAKQATAQKILDEVKDHDKDETFTQKDKRITAETDRDSAYDTAKEAERALADTVLISPVDGTVTEVNGVVGQWITALDNKTIVKIADPSLLYFGADIPQEDSMRISAGQKVNVELDANKGKTLEGTIYEVYDSTSENDEGEIVVPVKIKLNDDSNLKIGYEGDAQVTIEEKKDVLLVPKKVVVSNGQSVYIPNRNITAGIFGFIPFLEDLTLKSKKIKLGSFDGAKWEVVEGLNENEEILVRK